MRKIIFILALVIPLLTFSQNGKPIKKESFKDKGNLFKGYVAAGLNLNQIDGDNSAGYKSFGANIGVGAYVMYTKKFSNSLEISYSMRGAKKTIGKAQNPQGSFRYEMDYIEVPLLFNYHDFKIAVFSAGLSYNQIIRNKYFQNGNPAAVEVYKWNLDIVASVTFLIKKHWGLNIKYNYSVLNNLKYNGTARGGFIGPQSPQKSTKVGFGSNWYHNVLTFRGLYIF